MKKIFLILMLIISIFVFGCQNEAPVVLPKEEVMPENSETVVDDSGLTEPTGAEIAEIPEDIEAVVEETAEQQTNTHTVIFTATGFDPEELTIKVGDTVVWKNTRTDPRNSLAMVIGGMGCQEVKSKMLNKGQSFSWTFTKPKTCTIIDGYYTTITSKVIVEE